MNRIQFGILCVLLTMTIGCSTISREAYSELNTAFYPMKLEPMIDANMMRIDIIRNTHIKKEKNYSTEVEEDYSPICISMGNGIRLDTNGNLYFCIEEALNLGDHYRIKYKKGGEEIIVTRDGKKYNSIHTFLGIKSENDLLYTDDGLFDVTKNRLIVQKIENGFRELSYNIVGIAVLKKDLIKNNNIVSYNVVEGLNVYGETMLEQNSSSIFGKIRWLLKEIDFKMIMNANSLEINYDELLRKRQVVIQHNENTIVAIIDNMTGVEIKLSNKNAKVRYVYGFRGLIPILTEGVEKIIEIDVEKQ
jgi:hypothetical protein